GTWSAPPPPADGEDLYRPPSAPAVPTRHHTSAALAGRGTRLAAQVVDGLLAVPLGFGLALVEPDGPPVLSPDTQTLVLLAVAVAFLLLVAINLRLLYLHGQTIGKRVLGVRIVRLDGDRASLGRIVVLRTMAPSLVSGIPLLGMLFALVNYLFIFRDDRRCVHDHMADTKVVVA
ncbi:MAG TPA: RDD family protein, partial [Thermoanaerobaculia bacterium]